MPRGVDAELFHPAKRNARARSTATRCWALSAGCRSRKTSPCWSQIQQELEAHGRDNFRFLIVGHGGDEAWLRERLPRAEFTGVLRGEALPTAYANMDLFVFPSHTDTFGNVVLEALASGVPAIVTPDGGPRTIVRDGVTGRIVPDDQFAAAVAGILADPAQHARCARPPAPTPSPRVGTQSLRASTLATKRSCRASLRRYGKSRFQIFRGHSLDRATEGLSLIGPPPVPGRCTLQSWPSSLAPLQ